MDTRWTLAIDTRGRYSRWTLIHGEELSGLYLVVDPSGAKRRACRGIIHGKSCEPGFGSVAIVPLAEARFEAIA